MRVQRLLGFGLSLAAGGLLCAAAAAGPTTLYLPLVLNAAGAGTPQIGGCQVFPADNAWNRDISADPVDPNSANYLSYIAGLGGTGKLHADFGGGGLYGIPYLVVPAGEPLVPINFTAYGSESDAGPYPIPLTAPIEGGSDRHVLVVRSGECKLYELYAAVPQSGRWDADAGAVFDLNSNTLRTLYWTSADAAGLPILPGLARYDEVAAGAIHHALRVTFSQTQKAFVLPATHYASSITNPNAPPMGLRLRLKSSYNLSAYTGQARVILTALQHYGLIVADNGSNWFITGAADTHWDDVDLDQLKLVPGSAFEVVQVQPGTLYK